MNKDNSFLTEKPSIFIMSESQNSYLKWANSYHEEQPFILLGVLY